MQTEILDTMNSYQKTMYDTAKQFMDINTKAMTALMEKQMSVVSSCLNHNVEQIEMIKDAKDYASYMSRQAETMKACGEEAIETTRESIEILAKTRDELTSWMETGVSKVASKADSVAKSTAAAVKKAA